jgi:uncharacterized OsmC-like protein
MATAAAEVTNRVNGVSLDVLMETVGTIQKDPEMGKARFRASNTWVDGAYNRSTISGFYGACQEFAHKQTFTMEADEPPILAGQDNAPNPVEHLLHALASCLTTSMVAHAAVRGIEITELEAELEGDIDLNGFLGLDASVPKGFTEIRANFHVQADSEDLDQIRSLAAFSPVFNTITQGAKVDLYIDAK